MLAQLRSELCISDERHEELRQCVSSGEDRPWLRCAPCHLDISGAHIVNFQHGLLQAYAPCSRPACVTSHNACCECSGAVPLSTVSRPPCG